MRRFLWRLTWIIKARSFSAWKWTRFIDHRPLTDAEIKRGQELASELGLLRRVEKAEDRKP